MPTNFKNRKIRFREDDYVEKNYIKDGKAIIPIVLNSINELYMKHDFKKLELSDDLCDYIEEIAYIIPFKYPIVLEIHCPQISEEEKNKVRKVIKNNYGMEIDDRDYDVKEAYKKCASLFLLGVVLLLITYTFETFFPEIIEEFLYIAGWVALWEMVEQLILDNPKRKTERLNKLQIYDSEVTFIFDR